MTSVFFPVKILGLNQGQMLLMGFNGLFTKIDSDLDVLLAYLDNLHVPASWQKLDIYRDTVALVVNILFSFVLRLVIS